MSVRFAPAALAALLLCGIGRTAEDGAIVPGDGKAIHASHAVAPWMIGRFFGVNEGMEGHYVQLDISQVGHVIATVDRQIAFSGQIEGDQLNVDGTLFTLTQTDEGLRTQQVGNETNIVLYVRE